jgi:hypothetical protein
MVLIGEDGRLDENRLRQRQRAKSRRNLQREMQQGRRRQ